MEPIPNRAEFSIRRSRVRRSILVTLASLGEAYVGQLSRATGIRRERVRAALMGQHPGYRRSLSLTGLGLAEERHDGHGRYFVITTRGRRKARSLTSSWSRGRKKLEGE